jgi:hypothetical protein
MFLREQQFNYPAWQLNVSLEIFLRDYAVMLTGVSSVGFAEELLGKVGFKISLLKFFKNVMWFSL